MLRRIVIPVLFVCLALALCDLLAAQGTAPSANSDARYQALRHPTMGESFQVTNLLLKRDVGTFLFGSGTLCLLAPVDGMVTGAVFYGSGSFTLHAESPSEQRQIQLLTKGRELSENFANLALLFSDSTVDEIRASGSVKPSSTPCSADVMEQFNHELRKELKSNVAARLLQPVLAHKPDGYFMAFIKGNIFSNRMIFEIDPFASDEEVTLFTYQESRYGTWYSGRLHKARADEREVEHHYGFVIDKSYNLNTTIEKSGILSGEASVTFVANADSLWVVPLNLHSTLRVSRVTDAGGNPLAWIQEDKNEDADFAVILPRALPRGEGLTITTTYEGNDVVKREGNGNYYPIARQTWYPHAEGARFADYELTFHTPKGYLIAATGALVSSKVDGGQLVTVWKSEGPMALAGFNFGDFKTESVKLDAINTTVQAFVNRAPPDSLAALTHEEPSSMNPDHYGDTEGRTSLGNLSTTPLMKKALAEAQISMQIYTDFYGPIPFKSIQVTQQAAWTYGQGFPELVFLPITYFLDTTQRHALGWDETTPYFRVVEPHEVAHQWFFNTVGVSSYRDVWLSEGFADFSASLFLQAVYPNQTEYRNFWMDQRRLLLERNKEGFRAIDVGPLVMGYRVNSSRTGGDIYRELIYAKGSYVLHMLRMLMFNADKDGDARFKTMMHDYVKTYTGRAASTEDFQRIAEKYMTPGMDLDGNHRLNWFFDDWVYGTQLPDYSVSSQFLRDGENVLMDLSLTQRNVDDSFRNAMPIYLELADGRIVRLGTLGIKGNQTTKQRVPLGKMKDLPRRALINANFDTLCTIDGK